jgi:lipopolysaccharide export system permease protein
MTLIDRLLIRSFLKAYIVCLVSLLSLYVVVDLFTHLEDFSEHHQGLRPILVHIFTYYGYAISGIFDKLGEAIVLMAAAFTVALIQRNNELIPLLSAGVSTRRVVRPILLGAFAMLGLCVVNQELIIPNIGLRMMNDKDDPNGEKPTVVQGANEPAYEINIEGEIALPREGMVVRPMSVVIPETLAGELIHLHAEEGWYIPPGEGPRRGGWLLTKTSPPELKDWTRPDILEMIDPGKYFLYTNEVDFTMVTRARNWYTVASTLRLHQELSRPDSTRLAAMAVLFHMRLTRPFVGMILVLCGLSIILRDQNRNVFLSAGMCLALCALFFAAQFTCRSLGDNEYFSPALAAWLPVLFFGPLAVALFDAVHT